MVEKLKEEYNVDVEWRPFYLRPDTPPEGMELPDYIKQARNNGSEERLRSMANRMAWTSNRQSASTTRASHTKPPNMRANMAKAMSSIRSCFRKVYAEKQDLSQWDVLRSAAEEVGLNADEMQHEVDSGKYTANVAEQVQWRISDRRDRRANIRDQ